MTPPRSPLASKLKRTHMNDSTLVIDGSLVAFMHNGERYVGRVLGSNDMVVLVASQGQQFRCELASVEVTTDELDVTWYRQFNDGVAPARYGMESLFHTPSGDPLDTPMKDPNVKEDTGVEGDNGDSGSVNIKPMPRVNFLTGEGTKRIPWGDPETSELASEHLSKQFNEVAEKVRKRDRSWTHRARCFARTVLQAARTYREDGKRGV